MSKKFLLAACLGAVAPLSAKTLDIYVLTGQSNSLGTEANVAPSGTDTVTNAYVTPNTTATNAADASTAFWFDNFSANPGDAGDGTLGASSSWGTLAAQPGGVYANNAFHFGPEIGFARELYALGNRDFAVVKASRGGGSNFLWVRQTDGNGIVNWNASTGAGGAYFKLYNTIKSALTTLPAGYDGVNLVGLMYLQGESNTTADAAVADTRFSELLANLKIDFASAAGMKAVLGEIALGTTDRVTTDAKQKALADTRADIGYFTTSDLAKNADNLHFTAASQLTIGTRFADQFVALGTAVPEPSTYGLIGAGALAAAALVRRRRSRRADRAA